MAVLKTIRAKLTFTTVLVMATTLSVLGVVVYLAASRSLLASIDQLLLRRGTESQLSYERAVKRWQEGDKTRPPFRGPNSDPLRSLRNRYFNVATTLPLPNPKETPYIAADLELAKRGQSTFNTLHIDGQPVRIRTIPIMEGEKIAIVAQYPYALSDTYHALDNLRRILLILIPFGAALTGFASRFLIGKLMGPLRVITQNAEKIEASTLAERLPVVGRDEFANLAATLNGMLDRLQQGFELEQETSRRLEDSLKRQQRFTADASHELKTPLAVIKTNVSLARMDETTAGQVESLDAIDEAADRMNRLVQGLLLLAKAESRPNLSETEPCLLVEVAKRAVRQSAEKTVKVQVEAESATVMAVFDDLVRMVRNLVDNAVQHSGGDRIVVTVRDREIEVKDNGKGIAEHHLPNLFDRFYRVDPSRSSDTGGTGLGLAIAKGMAESYGGTLVVSSQIGGGTIFTAKF